MTIVDSLLRPIIKTIHDNCASFINIVKDYKLVCWVLCLLFLISIDILIFHVGLAKDNPLPIVPIICTLGYIVVTLMWFFDPHRY
jgi:hypothetical protein